MSQETFTWENTRSGNTLKQEIDYRIEKGETIVSVVPIETYVSPFTNSIAIQEALIIINSK